MQLMTEGSEEGNCQGLSWIKGRFFKFKPSRYFKAKIPHMGWNNVFISNGSEFKNLNAIPRLRYYFIHSYYLPFEDEKLHTFKTKYEIEFASGFEKDNIVGVQFHPEKSHQYGIHFMKKFLEFCNTDKEKFGNN